MELQLSLCLLWLTILLLNHVPPSLHPPVSNSSCLNMWYQPLYCTTILFKVLYWKIKNVFFTFCVCLFFTYYLCEKYYKPLTVQYYITNCVSWVSRFAGLMNKLDLWMCSQNRTHLYVCWELNEKKVEECSLETRAPLSIFSTLTPSADLAFHGSRNLSEGHRDLTSASSLSLTNAKEGDKNRNSRGVCSWIVRANGEKVREHLRDTNLRILEISFYFSWIS